MISDCWAEDLRHEFWSTIVAIIKEEFFSNNKTGKILFENSIHKKIIQISVSFA